MKPVLLAIGALIIILLAPSMLASVDDFLTNDHEAIYDVITAPAATTADVVFVESLYDSATSRVSISSNVTADAPIAASYVTATKTLTVSGLEADNTHRLTVTYEIDGLDLYPGAGVGAKVWPLFIILGVIGIIAGAVYSAVKHE